MPSLLGRVNLGLNGLTAGNLWYPLLNAWKMSDELIVISSTAPIDGNLRSDIPPGVLGQFGQESAWRRLDGTVYLTSAGELVNPLPADATHFIRRFQTISSNILPNAFSRAGEPWVMKFDGVAATITIALDNVVRVGNRITGNWPAGLSSRQVQFAGIDHNNPPVNIRFCPAAWESLLDSGEKFNPEWLAEAKRGSGIVRFMDWQVTNNNRSTRTFAEIPAESFYRYGGGNGSAPEGSTYLVAGMPVSIMSSLAQKCNSHPWVCIPHVFGTPKTAKVTGITQASPPVVTSANHPFVNGDQVIPYAFAGMTQSATVTITTATDTIAWASHPLLASNGVRFSTTGALPTGITAGQTYYVVGSSLVPGVSFQISAVPGGSAIDISGTQSGVQTATTEIVRNTFTVANATTDTFELAGVNSAGFSAFGSSLGWLTSPYSLSGITTEVTLLATHFRDNVKSPLQTYFEFSNECWNSIFDAFHWLAAQARSKFANDDSFRMTGYLLAHCMKTVRDVYGPISRSRWKGVLATHTINTATTTSIVAGVNQYLSENAPLVMVDLLDDLAVVGYWGGNLEEEHAAISQAWLDDSITRFNAGLEPTRYSYFNRSINQDLYDGRYTGIPFSVVGVRNNYWPAQKAIADSNGLGFIQYEAGNSNALNDGTGLTGNALWREFFPQSTQTAEDAGNYTAMMNEFIAIGGRFPSKFTEANPVNIFGSFGALRYPGDWNPTWNAVCDFNDKLWCGRLR